MALQAAKAVVVRVTIGFSDRAWVRGATSIRTSLRSVHLGVLPVVGIVAEVPHVELGWKVLDVEAGNRSPDVSLEAFQLSCALVIVVAVTFSDGARFRFGTKVSSICVSSRESLWQAEVVSLGEWIVAEIKVIPDLLESRDSRDRSIVIIFLPAHEPTLAVSVGVTIRSTDIAWVLWRATGRTLVVGWCHVLVQADGRFAEVGSCHLSWSRPIVAETDHAGTNKGATEKSSDNFLLLTVVGFWTDELIVLV